MFNYSDNGITVSAMLDTRRKNKHGLYPVRLRVTYQRQRQYYSTGKCLAEEDWDKLASTRNRELGAIRDSIQITAEKVRVAVKALIRDDIFSFDALNKRLGNATGDTLNTAFAAKIEGLKANGKVSTADWYKYTLRSIELFAGKQVKFSQVTVDWLRRYEKSLVEENKSYTTISMYMRALQVIINEAKAAGIIKPSQHPFGKGNYEIPQHEGRNIALTIGDIAKIVDHKCKTVTEERCRDLWFFSYLCNGANITDICKLKFSNINNGEIAFYRQKTLAKAKKKKQIQAVITPEMQAIIEKWGNSNSEPNNYIFPFLCGDETPVDERRIIKNVTSLMNKKMKDIGKELGIGSISTYTARHSYATVLKRSGANIAYISETLGHNDLKTTENYMARFEKEEREKNAALLTRFKEAS